MNREDWRSCSDCVNLIGEAKASILCCSFSTGKKNPCNLKLAKKETDGFGRWKTHFWSKSEWCSNYQAQNKKPTKLCNKCGFNILDKCFLYRYPENKHLEAKKWKKSKCRSYDTNPIEMKVKNTKIYKKLNKKFECRMSQNINMPITWRMASISCSLCEGRGGTHGCSLVDGYTRRNLEIEAEEELGISVHL